MYEVELKVPADVDAIRERLYDVGAERTAARRQRDVYYDAPHRDFAETDEALRVREEVPLSDGIGSSEGTDATTRVTYKGPLLDAGSKTREEHETVVADADAFANVLAGVGFEPAATVIKQREFWALEGFTVTVDVVDDVGEFVEIERAVDEEAAIDAARDEAARVLDRLGLDAADQVRTSYLGLLLGGHDD